MFNIVIVAVEDDCFRDETTEESSVMVMIFVYQITTKSSKTVYFTEYID